MGTSVVTIILAIAGVLATVAYRHPDAYRTLQPVLFLVFGIFFAGAFGYFIGSTTVQSVALTAVVSSSDIHDTMKVREATGAVMFPFWVFLVPGAIFGYLTLLGALPRLGIVDAKAIDVRKSTTD